VAEDSWELVIDCYEEYDNLSPDYSDFPSGATAKLYIAFADMSNTPLLLSTGTISTLNSVRMRVTFEVEPEVLTTDYAGSNQCIIIFRVTNTSDPYDIRRTAYQRIYVIDDAGDKSNDLAASKIPYTPYDGDDWTDTDPDDVAEALDDLANYKAHKAGSDDIEITDATKGWIFKTANGNRRRLTIDNDGLVTVSDPL